MSATRASPWPDVAALAAGCAIAWLTFFQPVFLGANDVPGDLGDARFNLYVLEHVYRWLSGEEGSLLSPGLFWPYPYALAFSDTHAGTVWVYAATRLAGLETYDAFKVWFALGYLGSFLAAYHVARKFAFGPLLALALSLAFAFSLPAVVQMGHAQLAWRVAVPYAFWFTLRYAEKGAPADFFRAFTALAAQMLISVYLGLFTVILCGLLFVGNFVARDGLSPRGWWRRAVVMASAFRRLDRHAVPSAVLAAGTLVALVALLWFHGYVARLYGIERPWFEISSMLPRLQSYLLSDALPYWAPLSRALPDVPVRNEQQVFLGIPLTVLCLAGLAYVLAEWRATSPRLRAVAFSILAALVLFTSIGGVSPYWILGHLPGFNSVRAVARMALVLAFPVTLFIGLLAREIGTRRSVPWLMPAAAIVIAAWMTFDLAVIEKHSFASAVSRERVEALRAAAPDGTRPVAFGAAADDNWFIHAIDAILAGQEAGRPTLNGYSGYMPPGVPVVPSCMASEVMLKRYDRWARKRGLPRLAALGQAPLALDMGPCDLSPEAIAALPLSSGPAFRREDAALIAIDDLRLTSGRVPVVSVRVTNGSRRTIHGRSPHPFRLSWRIGDNPNWDPRVDIGADLRPGRSRTLSWPVPDGTRLEDLSVSYVVEGDFWGHDAGFVPIRGGPSD